MSVNIVTLDDVSFSYRNSDVLEHITLDIVEGDYVGLIGPNGSGKTTLLKLLLGLLPLQNGKISLFGETISKFKHWEKIGYVPQKSAGVSFHFPITAMEVVMMNPHVRTKQAIEALKAVDMETLAHRPISEMSGGQQQRVFIARALASKPKLLVLDEPTIGIDSESQETFYELLKKLNEEHKITLIIVSHDIDVVAHEVKTVICVNKVLVAHGKPKQVMEGDFIGKLYGSHLRMVVHGH